MTSNHALQRVRRLLQARKGGHTGSLDPLATGMLPICLGQATKISAFLLGADKVYRFRICFGAETATGDAEGPVMRSGREDVDRADLERALRAFHGPIWQTPPMYSALKVGGRRLYDLARAGQEVFRQPRTVRIEELLVESYDPVRPVLRVRCGKGTYVRSLAEDIARAAGTVGHVAELRRLAVAPFPEAAMRTLEQLEAAVGGPEQFLLEPDAAIAAWPVVRLTASQAQAIGRGQSVRHEAVHPCGWVRLYDENGQFLGVGERLADGQIRPRRLMVRGETSLTPQDGL